MENKKVDLADIKGLSEKDVKMLKDADIMLGPEPEKMGFIKNMFWGNLRQDLVFPYPKSTAEETKRCEELLVKLEAYLKNEHPSVQIDQNEEIPDWALDRLFALGVMGMTIPKEYGGLGLGVTSYNRVLQLIGSYCASTAVITSAHQSIGCKALVLFGTEEQKKKYLPILANQHLSGFCLSEPNVGCDAGGQETHCELSADGTHYILNGEKKWTTSGYRAHLFTVTARQMVTQSDGKKADRITALICTPDMPGLHIFQKNRSKCGIRGTWQARVRFENVKVPRENLLHKEGKGLNVALTCLNYGRCTLSAGMLGAAQKCMDQGTKWGTTRFQFGRPLSDFELVKKQIANMSALTYAMDAVLYMTTAFMDRHDEDIMVETAACKVFCSEMGWRVINHSMQIMGGDGYMTENGVERAFRDSRIYLIVEGANEVMQSYIFGYGGKQLAEHMIGVQNSFVWESSQSMGQNLSRIIQNSMKVKLVGKAMRIGAELFLDIKRSAPVFKDLDPSLQERGGRLCALIRDHSFYFKKISMENAEKIVTRQAVQARIADVAVWIHAMSCVISKLNQQILEKDKIAEFEKEKMSAIYFLDMAEVEIKKLFREQYENADDSMRIAAECAIQYNNRLPNSEFVIPEKSKNAMGTGKVVSQDGIKQFPGN